MTEPALGGEPGRLPGGLPGRRSGRRSGRALQLGLVRGVRAGTHLVTFVVAAVCTILSTRAILAASGYPQIGGGGLHVAHVLPGGLLMLIAQVLLLAYVGPVMRQLAALIGGIGFGLFVDEVGKFVTSDNDYFYRPATAIMYVLFVLVVLAIRWLTGRALDPREHLANAVDQAVEGVAGGLSPRLRAEAERQIDRAGPDVAGAAEVRALISRCEADDVEVPRVAERAQDLVVRLLDRAVSHPAAGAVIAILLVGQGFGSLIWMTVRQVRSGAAWSDVAYWGVVAGCVLALAATGIGLRRARRHEREGAVRAYFLALLAFLLVVRFFEFASTQFGAVAGLLLDLVLLGLVSAELQRLRRTVGAT